MQSEAVDLHAKLMLHHQCIVPSAPCGIARMLVSSLFSASTALVSSVTAPQSFFGLRRSIAWHFCRLVRFA